MKRAAVKVRAHRLGPDWLDVICTAPACPWHLTVNLQGSPVGQAQALADIRAHLRKHP